MLSNTDTDRVNQLLSEKRYEEAKAILRQSSDAQAQKWLEKLEQLFPAQASAKPAPELTSDYGPYGLENRSGYGRVSTTQGRAPSSSSYSYAPQYERGGCLTVFLIFVGLANVLELLLSPNLIVLIFVVFILACIAGVWNRQKWGYFGLMLAYVLNLLLAVFMVGSIPIAIGAVIGMTITYALINPQLDYFS
jgi:hypothetical protein